MISTTSSIPTTSIIKACLGSGGYEELDVTVADLIPGPDRVAARLVWSGVRRSGEIARRETLEIVRIESGKAIEHWGGHS